FAVGERGGEEFAEADHIRQTGLGAEPAIVKFVREILGVIGAEAGVGVSVGCELPDDAIIGSIGRNAGSRPAITECISRLRDRIHVQRAFSEGVWFDVLCESLNVYAILKESRLAKEIW